MHAQIPEQYPAIFADRLLLRPIKESNLVGGLLAPETNAARPSLARVVLAGPGKVTEYGMCAPIEARAGDLVSFPSYAGQEIANPHGFPEGTYLMVNASELFINYGPKELPEEIYV